METIIKIEIKWEISHFHSEKGLLIQLWQYVNGVGDGGFSCLAKDYRQNINTFVGHGQLSLLLSNFCHEYIKKINI